MSHTIELPNGCWIGKMSVYPKNWKTTAASLKKDWYIFYRFHDPLYVGRYPKGKLCRVANMNEFKSLTRRQQETAEIMRAEKKMLVEEGFNPITSLFKLEEVPAQGDLHPGVPWPQAFTMAFDKLTCCKQMKSDIKSAKGYIIQAISALQMSALPIGQVSKKHVNWIMDHLAVHKPRNKYKKVAWSDAMYNKYRAYMIMLFKKIEAYEAIPANPALKIETKIRMKPVRQTLTDEQLTEVSNFLQKEHYRLYIFLGCFYTSGSREVELLALQGKDVDLKTRYFTRVIKKGSQLKQEPTIITTGALPYWQEAMRECQPDDYVFARRLKPGPQCIAQSQNPIGRYWNRHVKKKLKITADAYGLKHLFATKGITVVMEELKQARQLAAQHAGHTTSAMMNKVYDVNKNRLDEALRENKEEFK